MDKIKEKWKDEKKWNFIRYFNRTRSLSVQSFWGCHESLSILSTCRLGEGLWPCFQRVLWGVLESLLGSRAAAPPHRKESVPLVRMPPGRRPRVRTRTRCRDYISHLAWERLGIPQEELGSVAGERDGWVSLLDLLVLTRPQIRRRWWIFLEVRKIQQK